MSMRPLIVVVLCLSLLSAGGRALAGPWPTDATASDAISSDAVIGTGMRTAVKPCHDDTSSIDEIPDDDDFRLAAPSTSTDCCGLCDCGCAPMSAFAWLVSPLVDALEPVPVKSVHEQIASVTKPPLLRPPIA